MIMIIKKVIRIVLVLILVPVMTLSAFLVYITLTDYKPEPIVVLERSETMADSSLTQKSLSLISWNLGYAGLGNEMDFFYDGGSRVRDTYDNTLTNLQEILGFLKSSDSLPFWFLQEIDLDSDRTYNLDQMELVKNTLPSYYATFALNYKVPFVPLPPANPMGKVTSGMATLSDFKASESLRVAYPLITSWPDRLFLLDRCFILNRYLLADGRSLCLINTHNTAFIYDTVLRRKELETIKKVMLHEYNQGNFVVAGGDWNQEPPSFHPDAFFGGHRFGLTQVQMPENFLPNTWQWVYDNTLPTNRRVDTPYTKGETMTSTIDYLVFSPSITVETVRAIDLNFAHSDHNPIYVRFKLNLN